MINPQLSQIPFISSTACPISLLLVDDDLHFIRGLRTLLNFYSIYEKFAVSSRTQVIVKAFKLGFF